MLRTNFFLLLSAIFSGQFSSTDGQMMMPDYVCPGETKHYYVEDTPGSVYIWQIDGLIQQGQSSSEFTFTWTVVKTFLLEVHEITPDGCVGPIRSGLVHVSATGSEGLIVHAAFSPNGDLINDYWNIGNTALYPEMEVFVYNRWGQLIWRSGKGYARPWDGNFNGRTVPMDSYHYVIDLHNGTRPFVGVVTVVK